MEQGNRTLKVAGCQMMVSADVEANFAAIREGVGNAAKAGAALVVFPECALSGYPPLHHQSREQIDVGHIAQRNADVASAAAEFMVGVVFGTITERDGKLYNTAIVIDSTGRQIGSYDKMHLFEREVQFFTPGNRLPVFDIAGARVGVQICYDARFPEPFRYLKRQGTEVAVVISHATGDTWKLPAFEGVYRARSSENNFHVVAVNAAGPMQRALSRICDVEGISLAAADRDKAQMITADLDLSRVSDLYLSDLRTDVFHLETNLKE